jgi:hypothetical protein
MSSIQFAEGASSMSEELPYRVTAVDPRTGQRREYGRASDRTGADSLAASAKVQDFKVDGRWQGLRNVRLEKRTAAQQDMLDGRGGWIEIS